MIPGLSKPVNSHLLFRDLTFREKLKARRTSRHGQGLLRRGPAPSTMEASLVCTS
jgi:hypothetical protein